MEDVDLTRFLAQQVVELPEGLTVVRDPKATKESRLEALRSELRLYAAHCMVATPLTSSGNMARRKATKRQTVSNLAPIHGAYQHRQTVDWSTSEVPLQHRKTLTMGWSVKLTKSSTNRSSYLVLPVIEK
eukprot:GEMP01055986.1.p1 GENE.GEMP01055986.1~~GEMP01055986.1.p1  ORF type:complete len:130 (+),score=9.89 GEMP01055986.1:35-424(+)